MSKRNSLMLAVAATLGIGIATAGTPQPTTHVAATKTSTVRTSSAGVLYSRNATGARSVAPTIGNASVDAHDFVVDAAAGWAVTGFVFNAVGPNRVAPTPTITLHVYGDAGGAPDATALCSASSLPVTYTANAHEINASLASPCSLPTGNYHVSWSFDNANLTSGDWSASVAGLRLLGARPRIGRCVRSRHRTHGDAVRRRSERVRRREQRRSQRGAIRSTSATR